MGRYRKERVNGMMKKFLSGFLALLFLAINVDKGFATTTQVDALVELLVGKGIITRSEGIKLKGEIAADEKLIREEGLKQSLPPWVQDMKMKGDLRVRYQNERRDSTNSRHRGRVRMRLGLETKANDKVKVAVGLATGGNSTNGGDPRSTNQTLENSFEKPDLRLDYAYLQYAPTEWASLLGGKFLAPFWSPKDLVFDTDISFDGMAANFNKKHSDKLSSFFNTGFFILDENTADTTDPYMWFVQPGLTIKTTQNTSLKLASGLWWVDNVKGKPALAFTSSSNTLLGSLHRYDYRMFISNAEYAINNPFGLKQIPQLAFFGEFVNNPYADEQDNGFLAGVKIGDTKIAGPGQWQLSYNWRRLERNAVLDIFPDSDFYGGATHVQGQEMELQYGLGKNVFLALDYYRSAPIGGEDIDTRQARVENLVQVDLNVKFP